MTDTDVISTGRLLFLDATLHRVIRRFEEEYPECRESPPTPPPSSISPSSSPTSFPPRTSSNYPPPSLMDPSAASSTSTFAPFGSRSSPPLLLPEPLVEITRPLSRRSSEVSLHAKSLQEEEAQMLRLRNRMGEVEDEEDGEMTGEEVRRRVLERKGSGHGGHDEVAAEEMEEDVGPMGERRRAA